MHRRSRVGRPRVPQGQWGDTVRRRLPPDTEETNGEDERHTYRRCQTAGPVVVRDVVREVRDGEDEEDGESEDDEETQQRPRAGPLDLLAQPEHTVMLARAVGGRPGCGVLLRDFASQLA